MRPSEWAAANGFSKWTVWQWIRDGKMPDGVEVKRLKSGRYQVIDSRPEASYEKIPETIETQCVCYARVSSSDQKADLERQGDRLKAFAMNLGFDSPKVITEIASGMNGERKRLGEILSNSTYTPVIVEHKDRLARMNGELIIDALKAQDRKVVVIDDSEMDDDLVSDVISVMTSFCARLYGRRSAKARAKAALEAAKNARV